MPTPTRQRLVDSARERFYRDGFRNVGLDQILKDVAISKTAFYKHFASKEDLMYEVLAQQDEWLQQTFQEIVSQQGGETSEGQLRALMDVVEQLVESDGFQGCIFVNAAMEFPLPHDPAHQAAARNKLAIERIVTNIAQRTDADDPDALAQELCLVMEGAYVTRQVTNNPATIAVARRVANNVIAAYIGAC